MSSPRLLAGPIAPSAAPDVRVELGLEPKPGIPKPDEVVARHAIAMLRTSVAGCLRGDAKANGPSAKLSMSIDVHADGVAAPAFPIWFDVVKK